MRKILLLFAFSILLIGSVSAAEWDNFKSYDSIKKKATIENALGFGSTIAEITLNTPHVVNVAPGKDRLFAEITIDSRQEYTEALKAMKFYDLKNNNNPLSNPITYKIKNVQTIVVPNYERACSVVANGSQICSTVQKGTKQEEQISWSTLNGRNIGKGNITLGLFTDVKEGDLIEWIPTLFGVDIEEWAIMASDPANMVYWKFDETTGVIADNAHNPGKFNATLENADQHNTTNFKLGVASVNMFARKANVVDAVPLNGRNWSLSLWVYRTALSDGDNILGQGTSGLMDNELFVYFESDNTPRVSFFSNQIVQGAADTTLNQWIHYVFTYGTNKTGTIYRNGVLVGNGTGAGNQYAGTGQLKIGSRVDGSNLFAGNFDEMYLLNRTIDQSEAQYLYNAGAGRQYPFTSVGSVNLSYPSNNANFTTLTGQTMNATAVVSTGTAVNATRYLYTNAGALIRTDFTDYVPNNKSNFTFSFLPPLSDGTYLWNVQMCGNDGVCAFAPANFTFGLDSTAPKVNITTPQNNTYVYPNNQTFAQFLVNASLTETNPNTCWFNTSYNATFTYVTCGIARQVNLTNTFGNFTLNYSMNDTLNSIGFNISYFIIPKISFNTQATVGSVETFTINTTALLGKTISQLNLVYNSTSYSGTLTTDSGGYTTGTRMLTIPSYNTTVNVPFYWNTVFSDGSMSNSSVYNQNITVISFDNCATNTLRFMNLTLYDQDTLARVNTTSNSTTIEVLLNLYTANSSNLITTFNSSFANANNVSICINANALNTSSYELDYQIKFSGTNYATQYVNGQNVLINNATIPQLISLYDLINSRATRFAVTFKDTDLLPVSNAIIKVTRKYIAQNQFLVTESPLTDNAGRAIVNLVTGTEIYTIIVMKDGVILGTFDNQVAKCANEVTGECNIPLNAVRSAINPVNFLTNNNLNYVFNWVAGTRTLTTIFSTQDTSNQNISQRVMQLNNFANTTICYDSLVTSAGQFTCAVPASYGNITIIADLFINGNFVDTDVERIGPDSEDTFGGTRVVLGMLMYSTLTMLFISNPIAIIIGSLLGFIFAAMFFIVDGGSFFGNSSILLYIMIAGGILIWQINKKI